ncbi:MAG TPA: RNA-binding protein [Methanosarcinales archaeon]|nr:RNA-binding protein [Methanosarcinales archaeon]
MKNNFVLPGDFIGTTEEYIAGNGTYEEVGDIYASATGKVNIDNKTRSVHVEPETCTPPTIKKGDIVIGRIINIKGPIALVEIAHIKGAGNREIINLMPAVIHVSNVKDSYVKELYYEFSEFDIVKAKVIDSIYLRLSTIDRDLGVIKAFCSRCKIALIKSNINRGRLECPKCKRTASRKISSDYGTGII